MLLWQNKPGNITASIHIPTLLAGLIISLLGALPLGNLNITALHIASSQSFGKALWFVAGVVFIEVAYLYITLTALNPIIGNVMVYKILQWVSVFVLLAFAIGSFRAVVKSAAKATNVLIDNNVNRFVLGIGMSALNPMQFPFWIGWSVYAQTQQWLQPNYLSYFYFVTGVGLGTFLAMLPFVFIGKKFANLLNRNPKTVHFIMGVLFFTMAIYQALTL